MLNTYDDIFIGHPGSLSAQKLDILWEPAGGGVRILRVYGEHPVVMLPETIEGQPVTEIGAYCFSRSEPRLPEQYFHYHTDILPDTGTRSDSNVLPDSNTQPDSPHGPDAGAYEKAAADSEQRSQLSCLSGSSVEAVWLPSSVTTLHNAAFYNCRKLHTLSAGAGIQSIGSDEFMNCTSLSRLIMRCSDTEAEGLPLLLERYAEDLLVLFVPEADPISGSVSEKRTENETAFSGHTAVSAALFFPEYYEWLDEISPAHIFSRSIHGEGFRMRKCFENGRINYEKYDLCFENALKVESDESLCRIAIQRLRWPNGLKETAESLYTDALTARLSTAISMAVKARDLPLLLFLCGYFSAGDYSAAISACVDADWGEGSARLMEEQHRHGNFAGKNFDFDDF